VLHTFASMLLRTTTNSRVVLDGQYGAVLGVAHLAPFLMAAHSSGSGGGGGGGSSAGGSVPGSPMVDGAGRRQAGDDAAGRRAFFEVG